MYISFDWSSNDKSCSNNDNITAIKPLRGYGTLKYGDAHEKFNLGNSRIFRPDLSKTVVTVNVRGYPYFLNHEMEVASLFNTSLVSDCEKNLFRLPVLAEPEEGCQIR